MYRSICLEPTAAERERERKRQTEKGCRVGNNSSLNTCTACTRLSESQCETLSFNDGLPNASQWNIEHLLIAVSKTHWKILHVAQAGTGKSCHIKRVKFSNSSRIAPLQTACWGKQNTGGYRNSKSIPKIKACLQVCAVRINAYLQSMWLLCE